MVTIAKFDFGNSGVPTVKGYYKIERVYSSPRYMWIDEMKNTWRSVEAPTPLKDFLYGPQAEFRVGLPADTYTIKLYFCDQKQAWEPFSVAVRSVDGWLPRGEGKEYLRLDVEVPANEVVIKEFEINHDGKALAFDFCGENGKEFMVSAMEIFCENPHDMEQIIPAAPSDILPSVEEVEKNGNTDTLSYLNQLCQWLIDHRKADGFLGDYEFSQRLWYTTSYPIRTFLAAYQLTGKQEYMDITTDIVDLLVSEQMPESSFTQAYRQQPTNTLTEAQLEEVRQHNWMNLADVGSMVAALISACAYVTGERKEKYVTAARNYLDNWVSRFRHEDGSYDNGWLGGHYATNVYSVATSNSALCQALFYQITGEEKYIKLAEETAMFMVQGWSEKGRYLNWMFDNGYPGYPTHQNVVEFGDLFYSLEALSAILCISKNMEVKRAIYNAFHCYLFGSEGLFAAKRNLPWWPIDNYWHMSKSAGMPIILYDFIQYADEMGADKEEVALAKKEYDICCKYLCTPEYSRAIGVCCEYYDGPLPFRNTSILSWTGCAVAATGFAGIAVAQMIKSGLIFLK